MDNKSLDRVEQFVCLRTILINQNSSNQEFKCRLDKEFGAEAFPSSSLSKNIKNELHIPSYVCCYLRALSLVCHIERRI
jgi:hypothetical protein